MSNSFITCILTSTSRTTKHTIQKRHDFLSRGHRHLFLVNTKYTQILIIPQGTSPFIWLKLLCHRDFRVFSTRQTPAWRSGLHHLKLRQFIYKMMYKTPTFAEPQQYNIHLSWGHVSAFINQYGNRHLVLVGL